MILQFDHRARMARRIAAYHAGELTSTACEAFSRHLAGCPHCSEELRSLEETDRLLRGAAPRVASLPPDASRILFARALDESGVLRRRASARWQLYAWATPAVLLLLGSGLAVREVCKPAPTAERLAAVAPPAPQVVRTKPAADTTAETPAPKPAIRAVAPARKRLVRASAPRTVKAKPEIVKLLPSTPVEWTPEPVLAPGVERMELIADGEPAPPMAPAARLAAYSPPAPVVDVQVTMVETEPAGTARAAAYWREPSGEWFWKQARVPNDEKLVELVLVSLSQDRVWGYWKEKTE